MAGDSGKSADKTKEGGIDHDSPYYLHPSDYPRQKDVKRSSSKPVGNCTNCGKDGHNRDGCFELIGYPDWWPGKGKQDKAKLSAACVEAEKSPIAGLSDFQYQQFLKFFRNKEGANGEESGPKANLAGNIDKEGKWIFDLGTTEHITHNDSLLKNKRKRGYEQPVTIPNGEAVPVEGRGECALPSGAIIKDVLHVPKFKCNLLSVSRLSKELQCAVTFFPEFCIMQDLYSRTLIGAGDCEDGLYKMGMFENNRHAMMTTQTVKDVRWIEAMKQEIQALEENKTWTLEELPKGKRAIDSKWVYKIKYKPNGDVERYKAHLVAKGCTQMEGVDFHETFTPVAKLVTVRTLLTVAVKRNWHIHQLDVNNAFLHGDLNEGVYMKLSEGFGKQDDNRVCKLKKSLYGLKQASRNWYKKFTHSLLDVGFKQSHADHSLFIFKEKDAFVAALIYVDDVVLVGNDPHKIQYQGIPG
ncbi:putative RNA-directed DNA polymerase [Tanacetum coccineum]|uniref:RNA-directed DNA polymerase n=1 Tax=Tanacetum coccineum TaxID=301880 RepID=A0ABQ5IR66_9ASTR